MKERTENKTVSEHWREILPRGYTWHEKESYRTPRTNAPGPGVWLAAVIVVIIIIFEILH